MCVGGGGGNGRERLVAGRVSVCVGGGTRG